MTTVPFRMTAIPTHMTAILLSRFEKLTLNRQITYYVTYIQIPPAILMFPAAVYFLRANQGWLRLLITLFVFYNLEQAFLFLLVSLTKLSFPALVL